MEDAEEVEALTIETNRDEPHFVLRIDGQGFKLTADQGTLIMRALVMYAKL